MMEENKRPIYPEQEAGNYVEQTEAQIAQAQKYAAEQERKAKRERDMAILSDIANLVTKGAAVAGGAWKINKDESATAATNEKLRALRDSNSKQLVEYAKMRMAAADAARKERNAEKLAQYNADLNNYKLDIEAAKYANEQAYKERREAREIAESDAKKAYYKAQENYYNSGGKKTSSGGSGVNRDVYLINDDGTKKVFKHSENANNIQAAYAELPPEYRVTEQQIVYTENRDGNPVKKIDENGLPVTISVVKTKGVTLEEKKQAIERYNARERKKTASAAPANASPLNKGKKSNNKKDTGSW